ncbi:hypothetical protein AVEN_186377-1, partial [Araneus ventricosus]
ELVRFSDMIVTKLRPPSEGDEPVLRFESKRNNTHTRRATPVRQVVHKNPLLKPLPEIGPETVCAEKRRSFKPCL